jgi:uncharacterized iron-regulated membrane protein
MLRYNLSFNITYECTRGDSMKFSVIPSIRVHTGHIFLLQLQIYICIYCQYILLTSTLK